MPEIISKMEAKTKGLKQYFTGVPCKRGHIANRYVTGDCIICAVIRMRDWQKRNPERVANRNRKWHLANPEKRAECNRQWHKANLERCRENARRWEKNNPEKLTVYRRNCWSKRRGAEGYHTKKDIDILFIRQKGKCANCGTSIHGKIKWGKLTRLAYAVDHVIPLQPKTGGVRGTNWPHNLQLLCHPCNCRKRNKDPIKWAQENGRLL